MVRDDNFFTGVIEERGYALWSSKIKNPDHSLDHSLVNSLIRWNYSFTPKLVGK